MISTNENIESEQLFAARAHQAMVALGELVEMDPQKLGGVPILRGTRFSIPQLLAEIADGDSVEDVADNFELDKQQVQKFFHALAVFLDKPSV